MLWPFRAFHILLLERTRPDRPSLIWVCYHGQVIVPRCLIAFEPSKMQLSSFQIWYCYYSGYVTDPAPAGEVSTRSIFFG